jgi:hypothetical protein
MSRSREIFLIANELTKRGEIHLTLDTVSDVERKVVVVTTKP